MQNSSRRVLEMIRAVWLDCSLHDSSPYSISCFATFHLCDRRNTTTTPDRLLFRKRSFYDALQPGKSTAHGRL
jgi:hypothetical protein